MPASFASLLLDAENNEFVILPGEETYNGGKFQKIYFRRTIGNHRFIKTRFLSALHRCHWGFAISQDYRKFNYLLINWRRI